MKKTMHAEAEQGGSTLEHVGIGVAAVALVAALATTGLDGVASSVTGAVTLLCRTVSQGCAAPGGLEGPGGPGGADEAPAQNGGADQPGGPIITPLIDPDGHAGGERPGEAPDHGDPG